MLFSNFRADQRTRLIASLAICAVTPFLSALAQETSTPATEPDSDLEALGQIQVESIYSASRYEQKVTKAPASASIVTRDEIQKFGYRNLAEVLRSIRGFNVSYDRNYAYIGLRGFQRPGDYSTRVLVMVDGHRMNDNLFDSGMLGLESFVDVDMIERVEVVRGPGSVMYGSNAFFGVVNIVTRTGAQLNGAEVSAEAGSFDTAKGRFSYGTKLKNDVEFAVSGTYFTSEGNDKIYYPEFNGYALNSDEETARFLYGRISYHGLSLEGNYYWRDKNIPTASFGTIFNDGREQTHDVRSFAELRYETPAEADLGVSAAVSYDDYYYNGVYPYDYGLGFVTMNRDKLLGQWITPKLDLRKTYWDRVTLMVGGDARLNVTQHRLNYDDNPYFEYTHTIKERNNYGGFAQLDVAALENLNVIGGLSYDYFEDVGGSMTPRGGVVWQAAKNSTLKFLYGHAFRAPNNYELEGPQVAGARLKPETVHTYEIVADQYFLKNYRASLSLYHMDVDDMITQIPYNLQNYNFALVNGAEAKGIGAETEFEARFSHGILARASYALQRSTQGGVELSNSPRHTVKTGLVLPVWPERIFSGLEVQYTSAARTLQGGKARQFVILNWNLFARDLLPGLEASAGVYNLLNEHYGYPGAVDHAQQVIAQDGRSFRVKLTYHF